MNDEEIPEAVELPKPKKKVKEPETKYPKWNKRYDVGLAKKDDPCCFVDFKETDVFEDAKNACINKACDEEREAIVFDNRIGFITFRYKPEGVIKDDTTIPPAVKPKPKRHRK